MPKLPPSCLTPVFAPLILGSGPPAAAQLGSVVRLLHRYGHLLGDHVLLGCESIPAIEAVRAAGKRPVPLICFRSWPQRRVDLATARPPDAAYAGYLAHVLARAADFDFVTVGNEFMEVGGLPASPERNVFHDVRAGLSDILRDLRAAEARFPQLAGRTVFGVMDWNLEREAMACRDALEQAPLRRFLTRRGCPTYVWTGFWPLFPDKAAVVAMYPDAYALGHLGGVPETYPFKGPFPFDHYRAYLRGLRAVSGIGYRSGARAHHLRRLVDYGYAGCLFLLPTHLPEAEQADAMRDYLTDVEGAGGA